MSEPVDITSMQFKWDMHLIYWFHNHKDATMFACMCEFYRKYKAYASSWNIEEKRYDPTLPRLLRTPNAYHMGKCRVAVYLNTYLPKLNKVLWQTKPHDAFDIVCKLGKYDVGKYKKLKEADEMREARVAYRKSMTERTLDTDLYKSQSTKKYNNQHKRKPDGI